MGSLHGKGLQNANTGTTASTETCLPIPAFLGRACDRQWLGDILQGFCWFGSESTAGSPSRLLNTPKVKGTSQDERLRWDPSFLPQQAPLKPEQKMQLPHTYLDVEFKSCFTSSAPLYLRCIHCIGVAVWEGTGVTGDGSELLKGTVKWEKTQSRKPWPGKETPH